MLSLAIHHNVYLTKDQRYALNAGEDLEIVGVSVPVWTYNNATSEPAREVFCKYYLKNPKQDDIPIKIVPDGYVIVLPHRETDDFTFSSKCLMDVKDGGSASIFYREQNRIRDEINRKAVVVVHYVHIRDLSVLEGSMTTSNLLAEEKSAS